MRIIAGEARGRKLFAPAGEDTRPTADRIRESLFNIIGSRMSFDLSVFAQTCFDRIFSGMNRRARGLSYC